MPDQITVTAVRRQCRHIFPDGHRCGSPCLRSEEFCYYHHTTRKPAPHRPRYQPGFDIATPDNRATVQLALGEILSRIASEQIDPRRAGLLLYGLQIASINLPRQAALRSAPEFSVVEDLIDDPELGPIATPAEFKRTGGQKNLEEILTERWDLEKEEQRQAELKAKTPAPTPEPGPDPNSNPSPDLNQIV